MRPNRDVEQASGVFPTCLAVQGMWTDFPTMSSGKTFCRFAVTSSLTDVPKRDDLCLIVRDTFEG